MTAPCHISLQDRFPDANGSSCHRADAATADGVVDDWLLLTMLLLTVLLLKVLLMMCQR